jgi:hypothetical protein
MTKPSEPSALADQETCAGQAAAPAPVGSPPPGPGAPPRRRASRLIDIAAEAGVHVSTVSRVLNGDPALSIRPETYERVLSAARAQGYRPNALARALKQRRTGAMALVVPLLRNPIWTRLQRGALQQARERGYVVMIMEEPTEEPRPPATWSRRAGSTGCSWPPRSGCPSITPACRPSRTSTSTGAARTRATT